MIIGILLGISLATAITSLIIIITGLTGALQKNLVTGSVIGPTGAISYAIIALAISTIAILFLSLILKKPKLTE